MNKYNNLVVICLLALATSSCSFQPFSKLITKNAYPKEAYDAVIVPGFPYYVHSPHMIIKARMLWAKHLYDNGATKNLIFSGGAVTTPYIEGLVMKSMADSMGIPTQSSFAETRADHSKENIYYSVKMAQEMGFKNIAVATDIVQSLMLRSYIKEKFPTIKLIPIDFEAIDFKETILPCVDHESTLCKTYIPLHVRKSFKERREGTNGNHIAYEVE